MLRSLAQRSVVTRFCRFHKPAFCRWTSTASGKGSDDNDDDMTEWVPPNRPLSMSGIVPEYHKIKKMPLQESPSSAVSKFREKLIDNDEIDMEEYERIIQELEEAETGELNDEEELFDEDGFLVDYDSDDDEEIRNNISMGEFDKDGNLILGNDEEEENIPIEEFQGSDEEWDEYMRQMKELEDDDSDNDNDDNDFNEGFGNTAVQEAELVEKIVDDSSDDQVVDWTATRRSKLNAIDFMTPDQAQKARQDADLPVIKHTLLSANEIMTCLESLGGTEISLLPVKHGLLDEAQGLILATGSHPAQVRLLAESVARNLKARKLADLGVVGARLGPEATEKYDTWQVVDCRNYIVHVFDEATREAIQLEKLWGSEATDSLRNVNANNDEAVDDYIANNPVPRNYNPGGDTENWENAMARLQRTNWVPPIGQGPDKQKRKKKKRRRGNR